MPSADFPVEGAIGAFMRGNKPRFYWGKEKEMSCIMPL